MMLSRRMNWDSYINRIGRFLFICLVVIILRICLDVSGEKPVLISLAEELIIEEGSELKIQCYSEDTPLHFSFPEYTIMSPRSSYEILPPHNGTWTFLRRSVVFLDTGWYACAAKEVEIENDFKTLNHTDEDIAWVYVYVSSLEPFADHYYTFPKTIIALAGSPCVIPCRPTSPDLNVKLWKNFQIVDPNEQASFDPKIGFIVEPPSSEDLETIFQCKVNGIEDVYILRYSNATGQRPTMNATGDVLILREGEELSIDCYGGTNIQFTFPQDYGQSYQTALQTSEHEFLSEEGKRTFIRRWVVPGDTGWYGCTEEGINPDIPPFYLDYTKKEINWIYVYVESENFSILGGTSFAVSSILNTSALVPCRPTSPKFVVELKSEFEVVKLDENVQFHPKLGFLFRRDLRPSKICYECSLPGRTYYSAPKCGYHTQMISQHPYIDSQHLLLLTSEDLHLKCSAGYSSAEIIFLKWNISTAVSRKRVERSLRRSFAQIVYDGRFIQRFEIKLTVKNVTVNDSGQYNCTFRDAQHEETRSTNVIAIHDHRSLDHTIDSVSSPYRFVGLRGRSVKWIVKNIRLFFDKKITWYTPSNPLIGFTSNTDRNKYKLQQFSNERLLLEIYNLTFNDAGLYRVVIPNFGYDRQVDITLEIEASPTVTIDGGSEAYYTAPGETFEIIFTISGSPRPNVTCSFVNYPILPPNEDASLMIPWNPEENFHEHEFRQVAALKMSTNISGSLTCTTCNSYNCSSGSKLIYVIDGIKDLAIIGPEENVYVGDDVVITCAAPTYGFQNLSWNEKFNECYENVDREMFYIVENRTQYTIRRVLQMKNVTECHQRLYYCLGQAINGDLKNSSYNLHLHSPKKPRFTNNTLTGSEIIIPLKLEKVTTESLYCCADGDPSPNISWFQNDILLEESIVYKFSLQKCQLDVVLNLLPQKGVRLTCKATNRFGEIEDYVDFVAGGGDGQNGNPLTVIISSVFVLIVLLVASLVIRKYLKKRANERLKEAILRRFDEGELNRLDPTLDIVDQAEVLPYDNEWEYPQHMLKLGKVLGSGAFGIVRRAEAKSIRPGEPVTTVAVKMVRPTSTLHHMMALSRELKVLVHLGQHLNVVNLLGACTKKVSYGELLVIIEFCRFGNLQEYLSRRRADFIDQVDPITGEINAPDLSTDSIDVDDNDSPTQSVNKNSDIVPDNSCSSDSTDGNVAADDEIVPTLRSEYRGDYTDDATGPIRTKDLLSWAWQVSRGMRYLGVRRVVHGDLAARNILLADNNVIKICDFGLAKALYKADHYKNGGGDPLPVKWMAIEAIKDLRFSIESDVWSFGIVLWEFFGLGNTPYPGIHARNIYEKLLEGYRMDKPKYAPKTMYRLMMNCWQAEPTNRPSFAEIETIIHELLDDSTKTYYMDLSNQYTEINAGNLANGKKDYLTMYPLQNQTVSFSVEQEEVEFSNIQSNESTEQLHPEDISETVNERTS